MVKVPVGPFDFDELDAAVPAVVLVQAAQQIAIAAAAPAGRTFFMSALLRDGHACAGPAVVGFEVELALENVGDRLDQPADRTVMPGHRLGCG
jgi:hypothetical protein